MTRASHDVRHISDRLERALALQPWDERSAHAQRGLRHDLSLAPRFLYGSPAWLSYRLWALARFERQARCTMQQPFSPMERS